MSPAQTARLAPSRNVMLSPLCGDKLPPFRIQNPSGDSNSRENHSITSGSFAPSSSFFFQRGRFREALTRPESRTAAILRFIRSSFDFPSGLYHLIAISFALYIAGPRGLADTSTDPPRCISPHYFPRGSWGYVQKLRRYFADGPVMARCSPVCVR